MEYLQYIFFLFCRNIAIFAHGSVSMSTDKQIPGSNPNSAVNFLKRKITPQKLGYSKIEKDGNDS